MILFDSDKKKITIILIVNMMQNYRLTVWIRYQSCNSTLVALATQRMLIET